MKILEQSEQKLVIGGWKIKLILLAGVYAALPVGIFLIVVVEQPSMIFGFLFVAAICVKLSLSLSFRERIAFDRLKGEVRFDQLKLLGWITRIRRINDESLVEIEKSELAETGDAPAWRMVLVTDGERTPFSSIYFTKSFEKEAALLNAWLGQEPDAGE